MSDGHESVAGEQQDGDRPISLYLGGVRQRSDGRGSEDSADSSNRFGSIRARRPDLGVPQARGGRQALFGPLVGSLAAAQIM